MQLIADIWKSFRAMPLWVQIWVALILVPVNNAAILFVDRPSGRLVAGLAIAGILANLPIMLATRGFSRAMALPHVALWLPLLALVMPGLMGREGLDATYRAFLYLLLTVDTVSLAFDIPDSVKWWRGDRAAAGR